MNKGQVSIEFITMLSLALLSSSILIGAISDRSLTLEEKSRTDAAEGVAQKTAYRVDYLISSNDSSTRLSYSSSLPKNFTVEIGSEYVRVDTVAGSTTFPTGYDGSKLVFGTETDHDLIYEQGELGLG